jgi:hypothetical protein
MKPVLIIVVSPKDACGVIAECGIARHSRCLSPSLSILAASAGGVEWLYLVEGHGPA